eukprot:PhM_4_TR16832/c0_g1_i1/m.9041/K11308/MYST1, MOF, KAT8; histone acetyltransferase MYST1
MPPKRHRSPSAASAQSRSPSRHHDNGNGDATAGSNAGATNAKGQGLVGRLVWFHPNDDAAPTAGRVIAVRSLGPTHSHLNGRAPATTSSLGRRKGGAASPPRASSVDVDDSDPEEAYVRVLYQDRNADVWVPVARLVTRLPRPQLKQSSSTSDVLKHEEWVAEAMHASHQSLVDPNWAWKPEYLERRREYEERWRQATAVRCIDTVYMRKWRIGAHYYSPYPAATLDGSRSLYICSHCVKDHRTEAELAAHSAVCNPRHPLGDEIYRGIGSDGVTLRVFELDGRSNVSQRQCQQLCLLGKLFIDHKTIITEVDDFVFYVLCEHDDTGCHVAGFFSKECEVNVENNNLACLVVLPQYQGKGYGRLLIELSYELSKREKRPGTPEQPLTRAARGAYLSYWRCVVLEALLLHYEGSEGTCSVAELSSRTGMVEHDVVIALVSLGIWQDDGSICLPRAVVAAHKAGLRRIKVKLDPKKMRWRW